MPPKSVPKLTKKQLEQQKKQQARLQKQKQDQQAAVLKAKLEQQQKIRQIDRKKKSQQQRLRIVNQKQKFYPILQQRIKLQNQSFSKLFQQQKWNKFTMPYFKNYSIQGTGLSTFVNLFKNFKHVDPKKTLAQCQQSEKYITKLQQKILQCRAEYRTKQQKQYQNYIKILQHEQLKKLQEIMIQFANSAQQMQQRNVEEAKKKNEQNAAQKIVKPVDNVSQMSPNFKIGMFINTISTKNFNKYYPLAIKQFGFNSQLPTKWANNTAIVKFQWINFNPWSQDTKKQQFRVVGGVFNLQYFDMFIGTKKASNITIKKYYKDKQILTNFKLPLTNLKQPFKVLYQIPSYVFMAPYAKSHIKLAQLDTTTNKWSLIANQNIMKQKQQKQRSYNCRITKPQPIAFVENRCADYPYIAWQLRTVQKGKILLDLQLARNVINKNGETQPLIIQFQIGPNVMKLQLNNNWPQLKDLTESYFTPEQILWQLSRRGIHILPIDDDYQFASLKKKDRQSQKSAIRDLAYAVESFTVRSEVNDSNDIRVKIRENLDHETIFLQDQQKDWKRIRWGDHDKCWVDGKGIAQRHYNLQTLLQNHDFCLKQCYDRMKFNTEYLLRKTIMKVLQLTRILSFTTSDSKKQTRLVEYLKQKMIVI